MIKLIDKKYFRHALESKYHLSILFIFITLCGLCLHSECKNTLILSKKNILEDVDLNQNWDTLTVMVVANSCYFDNFNPKRQCTQFCDYPLFPNPFNLISNRRIVDTSFSVYPGLDSILEPVRKYISKSNKIRMYRPFLRYSKYSSNCKHACRFTSFDYYLLEVKIITQRVIIKAEIDTIVSTNMKNIFASHSNMIHQTYFIKEIISIEAIKPNNRLSFGKINY